MRLELCRGEVKLIIITSADQTQLLDLIRADMQIVVLALVTTFVQLAGVVDAQPPPNHVVLNERRKHIDADSSWLDKTGQRVEHVSDSSLSSRHVYTKCIFRFHWMLLTKKRRSSICSIIKSVCRPAATATSRRQPSRAANARRCSGLAIVAVLRKPAVTSEFQFTDEQLAVRDHTILHSLAQQLVCNSDYACMTNLQ